MKELKIVFMGTPDFAVTILKGIIDQGGQVIGVITSPDKPSGRGQKTSQSAVKIFAMEHELNILQPTNLKDEDFQQNLKALNADVFVVVAFRMLPESVWSMPPKGTINLHASLLPQYRGAAPINWAIINGEQKTGVTTFFIEKEIDTGKILNSREVDITENMIAGELHDLLAEIGVQAMKETLNDVAANTTKPVDQNSIEIKYRKNAPKIFKEDCQINWQLPAENVHNFIRGMSPYPGAWTRIVFKGKQLSCRLFVSKKTDIPVKGEMQIKKSENAFLFPCQNHYISIAEIQIEGKRRMNFKDFSAGNSIEDLQLLIE